ncbi:DUF3413 domain-containing protein [Chromohalobacter sarecensis]|uniref:DUF3413 domain-containing protein n=1 Tax=Chromohalobacter sarecensis TaxID=245294 RepID=A0ABV9D409_9GAMM|nr:DUF3413 domain-containing protein [Chromohalobacter sarecensis]MCK0715850.1 DUF3413 domain-containing protein [Chromohalobacter sarecensis]
MSVFPRTVYQRLNWLSWFLFANVPLACLLATRFFVWMPIEGPASAAYITLTYIGQYALLTWLIGLPLVLLGLILKQRWLMIAAIVIATLGQFLLVIDIAVFSLYRFHLSGFVLNTIIKAGAHTFDFSWLEWTLASGALIVMLAVQGTIAWLLTRFRPRARWLGVGFAVLFAAQLGAHGWHAWADANYNTRITTLTRYVPLYYATTAKRFFKDQGWVDASANRDAQSVARLGRAEGSGRLDYPTQPLNCKTPAERPNILVIAVDALRADMLDPRWMPNTMRFANREAKTFTQHYSGGNSSKAGGFSLFYGLPSTYWDAYESSQTAPIWIRRLQNLDYQTEILSAATLISPAFDRTAFASIADIRLNPPGDEAWQRDRLITNDWLDFLQKRDRQGSPFFGFLFYKSVHGYDVPPDFPRIKPYWQTINRLALDDDFDPAPFFNRYKTSVQYVDQLMGRVLKDLKQRGVLEDTIVMITSDHGEEFNDNSKGYWGHGSNYSDAQLQVPMVVHWPDKRAERISYRTSHADIPASFMQALGCQATPPKTYAMGNGLLSQRKRDWMIAGSYMNYAMVTDDHLVVTHPTGRFETMTTELEPAPNYQPPAAMLNEALQAMSRFYR